MAKILIIEDDIHVQNMITRLLERQKYEVEAVFDGYDGLEKLKTDPYDLLITDMHLADMNGIEILQHMQDMDVVLPVIGISGGNVFDQRDMAMLDEANAFNLAYTFQKPFEHDAFLNAVSGILQPPAP